MSKVRIPINPKQVGKVGAYSMYVRDGEQIVRQRQNASNYGESASRTLIQQERRVRWANLVALFRVMKFWQPRAYEFLGVGQTDYNRFMSLNINAATVALTREEAASGATVIAPAVVSQGSLISPGLKIEGGTFILDVPFFVPSGTTITTVGRFSELLIGNGNMFANGDSLAFVALRGWKDVQGIPRMSCEYAELVLDTSSTDAFPWTSGNFELSYNSNTSSLVIGIDETGLEDVHGAAAIHCRMSSTGLQVSSERIVLKSDAYYDEYSTAAQLQLAVESYGLSTNVPLVPGGE